MKRILVFLTIICVIATVIVPMGASADSKKKVTVPYLSDATINIDASKDSAYTMSALSLSEQNLFRFPNSPQNSSGSFWLAYDKNFIYLYVDVEDGKIDYSYPDKGATWRRESIGVILDFDYIRTSNYKYQGYENICYVNLSGDNVMVTYHKYREGSALYNKIKRKTISNDGNGHILYELALPFPEGYNVQGGKKIGFEVSAINANNGDRVGHISWSEQGSLMDERLDVIGTIVLGDIPGEESVPEDDDNNTTPPSQDDTSSTEPESKPSSGTSSEDNKPTTSTPSSPGNKEDDTSSHPEDTSSDDTSSKDEIDPGEDKNDLSDDTSSKDEIDFDEDKNDLSDDTSSKDEIDSDEDKNDNEYKDDFTEDDDEEIPTIGATDSDDDSYPESNGTKTTTNTTESDGSSGFNVLLSVLVGIAVVAQLAAIIVVIIFNKKKNSTAG